MVNSLDRHKIPNVFAINNIVSQFIKQNLAELNEEMDKAQS